jgi:hypothetical protein
VRTRGLLCAHLLIDKVCTKAEGGEGLEGVAGVVFDDQAMATCERSTTGWMIAGNR